MSELSTDPTSPAMDAIAEGMARYLVHAEQQITRWHNDWDFYIAQARQNILSAIEWHPEGFGASTNLECFQDAITHIGYRNAYVADPENSSEKFHAKREALAEAARVALQQSIGHEFPLTWEQAQETEEGWEAYRMEGYLQEEIEQAAANQAAWEHLHPEQSDAWSRWFQGMERIPQDRERNRQEADAQAQALEDRSMVISVIQKVRARLQSLHGKQEQGHERDQHQNQTLGY